MTRALEEALLQHFIHQKLEIAYAINKPFPFFEGLRDNSFITERLYRESMEAWENLVPLCRVVYNILTQLEKTFSLSFLKILFSRINLKAYPNLITALSSFTRVVTSHGGWSRNTTIPLEAPANPAGKSSSRTLLLPCLPCRYPLRSLPPCAPSVSKPRAPAQHSSEVLREMPSPTDLTVALRGTIQEGRLRPVSSDNLIPQIKDKEDAQEMPCTSSDPVPVRRDDVPEPSDPKELQEASRTLPSKKGKKRKRCIWATSKKRQQKKSHQGSKMRTQEGAGGQRQLILVGQGATLPGHGIQKTLQGLDQVTHTEDNPTRNTKVVTRAQKRTECAPMPKSEEISDNTSEMDEGKRPQEPPSAPPRITHGKEKKRKIHNWSSSKKRQKKCLSKGAASSGLRIQETQKKDDSTRNSKVMTRAQKAQAEGARKPAQKDKAGGGTGHLKAQRGRVSRGARTEKPKDETFDFHSPELPVTCGEAKGILYKEKMKQGSSEKCIQNEKGVWFTPNEFEIEGKRKRSKNWKRSVFCGGNSLEKLLQKGILICPSSRKHLKTEGKSGAATILSAETVCDSKAVKVSQDSQQENSKECEVCCKGGSLLRCDTCPRFFHEDCHIPPSEAERSPWSCTFCRIKESSGNQQGLQESEVRARSMQPEEQLKCEFLLLKAYCHPQSSFFAETPCNASDLGQVGLDLEAEFEKGLKELLICHEASENSFQARP
ncbi:PREDICTED: sp110 nuclear body protein isoform X6 [Capra hircus]|uniref:sp110 nuclear body protein isoform X6 n=1 Tax=Capra hircus TaxID=9925 RepID=UPI000847AD91|nr:PREDICTED: sp110 nuclear body protein isoform X6 [Capra hircus]